MDFNNHSETIGSRILRLAGAAALAIEMLWPPLAHAQAPAQLVKDIATGPRYGGGSGAHNFVTIGNQSFFLAYRDEFGIGIWRTDGTADGTVMLKSFPSHNGSPSNLIGANGKLFFSACDDQHGCELWKSDGTAAGTSMVYDFSPGAVSSDIRSIVPAGDGGYGVICDGTYHDCRLARISPAGDVALDVYLSFGGSPPNFELTVVNDTLFVLPAADVTVAGRELYKYSPATGFLLVKDINPNGSSYPYSLTRVGSSLFFGVADDGNGCSGVWRSDGTDAGTIPVSSGVPSGCSYFSPLGATDSALFLSACDSVSNCGLWKIDGTPGGNAFLGSAPALTVSQPTLGVDGTLFFRGQNAAAGGELWKSDGTAPGTMLVKDILPGTASSNVSEFSNLNGTLLFTACDVAHGCELWKSDGTPAGTQLVKDIAAETGNADPSFLTAVGSTLFFSAADSLGDYELWKSDGSGSGTQRVKDIVPGIDGSYPRGITDVNGTAFFRGCEMFDGNSATGCGLWKSDGTAAGTVRIKDIDPGSGSIVNVNRTAFFTPIDGHLWKSDGTAAGTVDVDNTYRVDYAQLMNVNGNLFFTARDNTHGPALWKSDGTALGTVPVTTVATAYRPGYLTNVGGTLMFVICELTYGCELWKSDGTPTGTGLVKDINPGGDDAFASGFGGFNDPTSMVSVGGILFFQAYTPATGR